MMSLSKGPHERLDFARDRKYLAWIRTQPCLTCRTTRGIEAAHTGKAGMGIKSTDYSALPLCGPCHRTGAASYHNLGERRWSDAWGVDIGARVAAYRERYNQEQAK